MKSIKKTTLFLIAIVLFSFFLRFNKVTENPPSLNWDEASIGYNAYSILKTGKDEWGKFLPLHFKSFGEYKLPGQIYFSIPAIAIFGLNELGVRITPVFYGTLTVLVLYFLTKELYKGEKREEIALTTSFLLAISPWHIHLTRASFESSFSVFWVVLGLYFVLKGRSFQTSILFNFNWVLGILSFVIAIYTYNSARVFVPMFLFMLFFLYRKDILKQKKAGIFCGMLFLLLLVPLIPFSISGDVANRYKLVSIVDDPGLIPRIEEARNLSTLPPILSKLVNNRFSYLGYYFVSNYLAHFNPDYLFVHGAPHKQHHVQLVGQLYLFQAPFVVAALYFFVRKRQKWSLLLIFWILLAFVPVAITRDSIPHALRTILAAPAYQIMTAYGFWQLIAWMKSKKLKIYIVGITLATFAIMFRGYVDNYYNIYPKLYSRDWQYGYKEVVSFIKDNYHEYDQIVFSRHYGEPHIFTLFFLNWEPGKFQTDPNLNRFETFDWVRVLNFDKFYFPDLGDKGTTYEDIIKTSGFKKVLFVGKPGDFPDSVKKLKEVNFLNGQRAFEIVEYK